MPNTELGRQWPRQWLECSAAKHLTILHAIPLPSTYPPAVINKTGHIKRKHNRFYTPFGWGRACVRFGIVYRRDRTRHLFASDCRRTCILELKAFHLWWPVLLVQKPFVLLSLAVRVGEVELADLAICTRWNQSQQSIHQEAERCWLETKLPNLTESTF